MGVEEGRGWTIAPESNILMARTADLTKELDLPDFTLADLNLFRMVLCR